MGVRLAMALLLLASVPAVAQDAGAPSGLRPSIRADGPAASNSAAAKAAGTTTSPGASAATTAPAPPAAFSPIPPPPSAEQCRTRCAQDYYFCLAENEMSDCAPAWNQCRLTCNKAASAGG
jgi:hypothetical protein